MATRALRRAATASKEPWLALPDALAELGQVHAGSAVPEVQAAVGLALQRCLRGQTVPAVAGSLPAGVELTPGADKTLRAAEALLLSVACETEQEVAAGTGRRALRGIPALSGAHEAALAAHACRLGGPLSEAAARRALLRALHRAGAQWALPQGWLAGAPAERPDAAGEGLSVWVDRGLPGRCWLLSLRCEAGLRSAADARRLGTALLPRSDGADAATTTATTTTATAADAAAAAATTAASGTGSSAGTANPAPAGTTAGPGRLSGARAASPLAALLDALPNEVALLDAAQRTEPASSVSGFRQRLPDEEADGRAERSLLLLAAALVDAAPPALAAAGLGADDAAAEQEAGSGAAASAARRGTDPLEAPLWELYRRGQAPPSQLLSEALRSIRAVGRQGLAPRALRAVRGTGLRPDAGTGRQLAAMAADAGDADRAGAVSRAVGGAAGEVQGRMAGLRARLGRGEAAAAAAEVLALLDEEDCASGSASENDEANAAVAWTPEAAGWALRALREAAAAAERAAAGRLLRPVNPGQGSADDGSGRFRDDVHSGGLGNSDGDSDSGGSGGGGGGSGGGGSGGGDATDSGHGSGARSGGEASASGRRRRRRRQPLAPVEADHDRAADALAGAVAGAAADGWAMPGQVLVTSRSLWHRSGSLPKSRWGLLEARPDGGVDIGRTFLRRARWGAAAAEAARSERHRRASEQLGRVQAGARHLWGGAVFEADDDDSDAGGAGGDAGGESLNGERHGVARGPGAVCGPGVAAPGGGGLGAALGSSAASQRQSGADPIRSQNSATARACAAADAIWTRLAAGGWSPGPAACAEMAALKAVGRRPAEALLAVETAAALGHPLGSQLLRPGLRAARAAPAASGEAGTAAATSLLRPAALLRPLRPPLRTDGLLASLAPPGSLQRTAPRAVARPPPPAAATPHSDPVWALAAAAGIRPGVAPADALAPLATLLVHAQATGVAEAAAAGAAGNRWLAATVAGLMRSGFQTSAAELVRSLHPQGADPAPAAPWLQAGRVDAVRWRSHLRLRRPVPAFRQRLLAGVDLGTAERREGALLCLLGADEDGLSLAALQQRMEAEAAAAALERARLAEERMGARA